MKTGRPRPRSWGQVRSQHARDRATSAQVQQDNELCLAKPSHTETKAQICPDCPARTLHFTEGTHRKFNSYVHTGRLLASRPVSMFFPQRNVCVSLQPWTGVGKSTTALSKPAREFSPLPTTRRHPVLLREYEQPSSAPRTSFGTARFAGVSVLQRWHTWSLLPRTDFTQHRSSCLEQVRSQNTSPTALPERHQAMADFHIPVDDPGAAWEPHRPSPAAVDAAWEPRQTLLNPDGCMKRWKVALDPAAVSHRPSPAPATQSSLAHPTH